MNLRELCSRKTKMTYQLKIRKKEKRRKEREACLEQQSILRTLLTPPRTTLLRSGLAMMTTFLVESGMGEEECDEVVNEIEDEDDEGKEKENEEDSTEEKEKEEDEKTQKYKLHYYFNQIIGSLEGKYYSEFSISENLKNVGTEEQPSPRKSENEETPLIIKKDGEIVYSGGLQINQETLRTLFQGADDSPYGDMKNIETKVDKEVRNAKELTDISVSQSVLDLIKENWKQNMYPPNVTVVSYKLNMYTQDGFFKMHRDTPHTGLLGTALISLWGYDAKKIGNFELYDPADKNRHCWKPKTPECLMFYTDCPHEVEKYYDYSTNGKKSEPCIRATISFKIYEDVSVPQVSRDILKAQKIVQYIKKLRDSSNRASEEAPEYLKNIKGEKLGFILSHDYSLDINSLKGDDALILEAVKLLGVEYKLVPILQHFYLSSYHGESSTEDEYSSKVYLLSEHNIHYILDDGVTEPDPLNSEFDNVTFYNFKRKLFEWSTQQQQYIEFAGNSAEPELHNSVYISRAIIF